MEVNTQADFVTWIDATIAKLMGDAPESEWGHAWDSAECYARNIGLPDGVEALGNRISPLAFGCDTKGVWRDELRRRLANLRRTLTGQADGNQQPTADTELPVWNAANRTLTFRGEIIRNYSPQARNCIPVLEAFQESKWPRRIDDPLPAEGRCQERIENTCRSLNNKLRAIRFCSSYGGTGFSWQAEN